MLPIYNPQEFTQLIAKEQRPILAGCLQHDHTYREQKSLLRDIADNFGERYLVCLLHTEYLSEFCRCYAIAGTPSYLLFYKGEEKTRFLGHADALNLMNIVMVDDYSELDALGPCHGRLKDSADPVPNMSALLECKEG